MSPRNLKLKKAEDSDFDPSEIEYEPQTKNEDTIENPRSVHVTPFGSVSMDSDNQPQINAQLSDADISERTKDGLQMDQIMPNIVSIRRRPRFSADSDGKKKFHGARPETERIMHMNWKGKTIFEPVQPESSYIDSQYFGEYGKDTPQSPSQSSESSSHISSEQSNEIVPDKKVMHNNNQTKEMVNFRLKSRIQQEQELPKSNDDWADSIDDESPDLINPFDPDDQGKISPLDQPYLHQGDLNTNVQIQRREMKAIETIEDQRAEEMKRMKTLITGRDRDGSLECLFDLWEEVPVVEKMSTREIVDMIVERVIYFRDDLVAIDKPYGLAVQKGKGIDICLEDVLPHVKERLNSRGLHQWRTCNRLDMDTSGVMLISTTPQVANEVRELYRAKEIYKRYFAICKGIPEPRKGIIDVPIGRKIVSKNKYKMVPFSRDSKEKPTTGDLFDAVTEYQTVGARNKMSIIQCGMTSGVTHQLRCHLGFVMNCPILGDHKYTYYYGFKPQKLTGEALHRIGIRQSKVRHLPTYLHSAEVQIPLKAGWVSIKAPLPQHFISMCKRLAMNFPRYL